MCARLSAVLWANPEMPAVLVGGFGNAAGTCGLIRKRVAFQTSASAHKRLPDVRICPQARAKPPHLPTSDRQTSHLPTSPRQTSASAHKRLPNVRICPQETARRPHLPASAERAPSHAIANSTAVHGPRRPFVLIIWLAASDNAATSGDLPTFVGVILDPSAKGESV